MIDFSTLQGLTIPEGVVVRIESGGGVLWELQRSKPVVLNVKKITADTYASETTYTGEQFVLLDIYPEKNGTVRVSYGGITKTITDDGTSEEPNAQKVFFGTFNGVTDGVATPESGTLTIKGSFRAFACGTYEISKANTEYCDCITQIESFGDVSIIPPKAFYTSSLTLTELPVGIKEIGDWAFFSTSNVTITVIPEGVETIGNYSFEVFDYSVDGMIDLYLPSTLKKIGNGAFSHKTGGSGYVSLYQNVYIAATVPPECGDSHPIRREAFAEFPVVHVPPGCGDAYKSSAKWEDYTIVEM